MDASLSPGQACQVSPRCLPALLALVTLSLGTALAMSAATAPAADPLATLRPGHPRLLVHADDWARVRARIAADPLARAFHEGLIAQARQTLAEPPARYEKRGRRLLGVSRQIVGRVLGLAYAYRTTDDPVFARRAEAEMLAAAAFPDWNPSHFLDVGEMTAALALGCDWLDDALTPAARTAIRQAIITKGLRTGLDPADANNWWHVAEHNWNQVCWGGLTLGALLTADEEPALARQVLDLTRTFIPHGLKPYAPDGVYPEGPSYWSYGTTYQVILDAALASALGTDWDLAAAPGFLASAGAFAQTIGPSGRFYNFADGSETPAFQPALFWFARQTGDPGLLASELRLLGASPADFNRALGDRFAVLTLLWWPDRPAAIVPPTLPLRWLGRGPNSLAVFRESWTAPGSLYLALKGGSAALNHAHMDAGSFILEADGVRWAVELGMQDYYSLEAKKVDLWNMAQDSQRWQVHRLNHRTHNLVTIDDRPHRVAGRAQLTRFSTADANPHAIVDVSEVYADQAATARRGYRLLPGRQVLIQDEFTGLKPGSTLRWQMATRADVAVEGATATLRQDGQALHAQVLAPTAAFAVASAEPPADDFNAPNPGVRLLVATVTAPADGTVRLAVLLSPGAAAPVIPALVPLDAWSGPGDAVSAPSP